MKYLIKLIGGKRTFECAAFVHLFFTRFQLNLSLSFNISKASFLLNISKFYSDKNLFVDINLYLIFLLNMVYMYRKIKFSHTLSYYNIVEIIMYNGDKMLNIVLHYTFPFLNFKMTKR